MEKEAKEINILNCAQRNHADDRLLTIINEKGKQIKLKFCSADEKKYWIEAFKNVSKLMSESDQQSSTQSEDSLEIKVEKKMGA